MIGGGNVLSGEDAFKLHDTYGFPIDLTALMAREKGVSVDLSGFDGRMKEQKDRARAAGKFTIDMGTREAWTVINEGEDSHFVGYTSMETESVIRSVRKEGERYYLLLDVTPFYAESGGQVGDKGGITARRYPDFNSGREEKSGSFLSNVTDQLPEDLTGVWVARVDRLHRTETQKHHSATHLMHAALRKHLGNHVAQKGSLVEPDRLRFDFSHYEAVSAGVLEAVEAEINERIQQNIPVQIQNEGTH